VQTIRDVRFVPIPTEVQRSKDRAYSSASSAATSKLLRHAEAERLGDTIALLWPTAGVIRHLDKRATERPAGQQSAHVTVRRLFCIRLGSRRIDLVLNELGPVIV
jgi:hypothetical protein